MRRFCVTGRFKDRYTHDCPDCDGHETIESVREELDAASEVKAIEAIEAKYMPLDETEFEWVEKPDVKEVPERELLLRLSRKIAPVIPGLEDAIPEFYS